MKPVAAGVAIMVLLLTSLFMGPFTATAAAAPAPVDDRGPLHLDLSDMSPRVVTSDGPDNLTIVGTLTNTGTVTFDKLVVRVQRGDPIQTEGELRDALDGNANTDAATPDFLPLTDELAPGASMPIRLIVPLRGDHRLGLSLSETGVHEILVNINGSPHDGAEARLAAIRLLLPVLSLPPDPSAPSDRPATPTTGPAVPFSMLYPIADAPHVLPTLPNEPTVLSDDTLAASFTPDGRLGGLVAAFAEQAPAGSRVRAATCLAVDPDLVATAALMKSAYLVRGSDGAAVPGTGSAAATRWLDQLTAVARTGCVLALPYADADLVALTRGGLGDTAAAAIGDGRKVLADLLGAPLLTSTTWPVDGVVDDPTLAVIAKAASSAVVLSADGLDQGRTRRTSGVVPVAGTPTPVNAVLSDPLLTLAAAGPDPATRRTAGVGAAALPSSPAGSGSPLSTQDAIGALAFRAADGPSPAGPLVLAPPHDWAAEGVGARALLKSVGQLLDAGRLTARTLGDVVAQGPPAGTAARPAVYPTKAGGQEIPSTVIGAIRTSADDLTDLRSAVKDGSGVGIPPDDVFVPWRRGLVRPASAALRGRPDAARTAGDLTAGAFRDIRGTVRVIEPPNPYSLGTSDAPLPLTVANGLPFTMQVRIDLNSTIGLRMAAVPPLEIPPAGRRQVSVNAQVTRSGQFTVEASVRTPSGGTLGPTSRLSVRSTAYGTITVWLTASAGVLLVLLAGRRVLRRIRGEPGRHSGAGRSGPSEPMPPDTRDRTSPRSDQVPASPHPSSPHPSSPHRNNRTGDPFPVRTPDRDSFRPDQGRPAPGRSGPGPVPNSPVRPLPNNPVPNSPIPDGMVPNGPIPNGTVLHGPGTHGSPIPGRAGMNADRHPSVEDVAATDRFPAKPPGGSRPEPPHPPRPVPRTPTPRQ